MDFLPPGTRVVSTSFDGAITNRIRKPRSERDKPIKEQTVRTKRSPDAIAAGGKGLYRQNPDRRGNGCKVVCVSFVKDDLTRVDELAQKHNVNRSEMIALLLAAYEERKAT